MTWKFDLLKVGEVPTFLQAEFGNEVLKALNSLGNMTIEKGDRDEVLMSDDGIKIIYKFPPTGWKEKKITICEDGVGVDYIFLVKSANA